MKHGEDQWYSIGRAMGFIHSQIEACTSDKPSYASKPEAIIEEKVRESGIKETEKCLLAACKTIPKSIIGVVKAYIEKDTTS